MMLGTKLLRGCHRLQEGIQLRIWMRVLFVVLSECLMKHTTWSSSFKVQSKGSQMMEVQTTNYAYLAKEIMTQDNMMIHRQIMLVVWLLGILGVSTLSVTLLLKVVHEKSFLNMKKKCIGHKEQFDIVTKPNLLGQP